MRGIELYHVKANGWNDIGYNFLVDRYGQVFEGRRGGMQRNVIGAHAEGFNTGSVGIAVIGTYSGKAPTREAESALGALLAWRLDVGHVDPASSAMVTSRREGPALSPRGLRTPRCRLHGMPRECPLRAPWAAARGRADDGVAEALRPASRRAPRTVRSLQCPALPAARLGRHGEGAGRGSRCGEKRHRRSHLVVLGLLWPRARPLHVDDGGRRRASRARHRCRLGSARARTRAACAAAGERPRSPAPRRLARRRWLRGSADRAVHARASLRR